MKIEITRSPIDNETPGLFRVLNNDATVFSCDSLELPYINNEHGISCIPCGIYEWEKVPATAHIPYEHISIKNVPNRDGICIHIGNYAAGKKVDILGCVIVGDALKDVNGDGNLDIIDSKIVFEKLMAILPNNGQLIIK